ncbi:hypothetical protein BH24ACI3_BH24ACI3_17450 [soil metagenome]
MKTVMNDDRIRTLGQIRRFLDETADVELLIDTMANIFASSLSDNQSAKRFHVVKIQPFNTIHEQYSMP